MSDVVDNGVGAIYANRDMFGSDASHRGKVVDPLYKQQFPMRMRDPLRDYAWCALGGLLGVMGTLIGVFL